MNYYQTASELIAALANKKISSLELVEAEIARIEKFDKEINAVVVKDFDRARNAARQADDAIARGDHRPLLGLPITVKESFSVLGLPTTWGNALFKNWQPPEDSLVVARLKAAGAIILGKTNVPFMLDDWQSYNELFGTTNNPWNAKLTAGGSSGGSAAALAMGFVPLELGSDLAGSLRVPAHFCGVCAHKPSADLIPLRGSGPPAMPTTSARIDFVVAGPMARTATDLAIGLDVLAGPDPSTEGLGYQLSLVQPQQKRLKDYRVLLLDEHPIYPTSSPIKAVYDNLFEQLQKMGVRVSRSFSGMPDLVKIAKNFALLLGAWYSAIMTPEEYKKSQIAVKKLKDEDNSLAATFFRGETMNHRDWLLASRTREQLRDQWRKIYKEFDVVLCPITPTTAFAHDHSQKFSARTLDIDGKQFPYSQQYIWVSIATLFGLPATVVPIGQTPENLPVGIQIVGDYLQDFTTLAFAKELEQEFGGFIAPQLGKI